MSRESPLQWATRTLNLETSSEKRDSIDRAMKPTLVFVSSRITMTVAVRSHQNTALGRK